MKTKSAATKIFQKSKSLHKKGDYDGYLFFLKKASKKGCHQAQLELGLLYMNGKFPEREPALAFDWLSKSARQGNDAALYHLGSAYQLGEGTDKNSEKAALSYQKAAQKGHIKVSII